MKPYNGKSILIIGAGLLQVPAIEIANELGLTTIVTDYNQNAPGMKIADHPVIISSRDIDGTVRMMKEFNKKVNIDGVITVGTDASMTVAAVANALGLPGIEFENAEAASNKLKMRQRLEKHGVPIPRFYKCWSLEDLKNITKILSYPLVIKPVDNMGARGVMKLDNEAMIETAFYNAKKSSPSGELIIEEYMDGDELSIDSIVCNGEIKITGIADRLIEREPYFIEIGHIMPSILPKEKLDNAIDVFKRGVRALGITVGSAKGDIKVTKNGAMIVEIAARLSGGFMSAYTYPYSSGVNLIRNGIDVALGFTPNPKNLVPTKNWVSIEKAIIPQPGIIEKIEGIDEALSIPGVKNVFTRVEVGDEIIEPTCNVEKAGNIIVAKPTHEEALETIDLAAIKITTVKNKAISWNEICKKARERFNKTCFVCKECDGVECKGKIPGMGGIGDGSAFIRNYKDIKNILIKTKTIHDTTVVDTQVDFLGISLDLPLVAAPITGADINLGGNISEMEYASNIVEGCKEAGIIGFVGDGAQPELYKVGLEAIKNAGGHGGAIFKPRANQIDIIKRIEDSIKCRIKLVGVDIDAAAFLTMELMGQKVEPKTVEQLQELVEISEMPFIIKGIMSAEDAESAVKAGAAAIIISNHGGRITENHPSSISVLNEVSQKVKGKSKIIFDGGIRGGEDIFKAIALGADIVMAGRPFTIAVLGGGKEGIHILVKRYKEELRKIMLLTGSKRIEDIKEDMVIVPEFNKLAFKDNYMANF